MAETRTRRARSKPGPKKRESREALTAEPFWAQVYHLAGSVTRLKILIAIRAVETTVGSAPEPGLGTGLDVGDLTEICAVSGSAVSQHLAKLRAWGLIEAVVVANRRLYRIKDRQAVEHVVSPLLEVYDRALLNHPTHPTARS